MVGVFREGGASGAKLPADAGAVAFWNAHQLLQADRWIYAAERAFPWFTTDGESVNRDPESLLGAVPEMR